MNLNKFIGNNFALVLAVAAALGLFAPIPLTNETISLAIKTILIIVLSISMSKIAFKDVWKNLADQKGIITLLVTAKLLILPLIVAIFLIPLSNELRLGLLLIAAVPAGLSTPVLTDIVNGNLKLSVSLTVIQHILAPITIPLILAITQFGNTNNISLIELFWEIALLIFIPIILAQLLKLSKGSLNFIQNYGKSTSTILIGLIVYFSLINYADVILSDINFTLWGSLLNCIIFSFFLLAGYFMAFKADGPTKLSSMISTTFMNNALGIAIAFSIEPAAALIIILSELPWTGFTAMLPWLKNKIS